MANLDVRDMDTKACTFASMHKGVCEYTRERCVRYASVGVHGIIHARVIDAGCHFYKRHAQPDEENKN